MQNSVWKLTALTGVVGLVLLVLVQAQRGMNQPSLEDEFRSVEGDQKPGEQGSNFDLGDAMAFDSSDQFEPQEAFPNDTRDEPMNDRFLAEPSSDIDGGLDFRDRFDERADDRSTIRSFPDDPSSRFPEDSGPRFVRDATPPRGIDNSQDPFPAADNARLATDTGFDPYPLSNAPRDSRPTAPASPRGLFDDPADFSSDPPRRDLPRRDPAVIPVGNVEDEKTSPFPGDFPEKGGTGPRLLAPDSAKRLEPLEKDLPDFSDDKPFADDFPTGKKEPAATRSSAASVARDVEPLFPQDDRDGPFSKRTADTPPESPLPLRTPRNAIPLPSIDDASRQDDETISSQSLSGRQQPLLAIEKVAPENAVLGQPMIYSIIVKNIGKTAASQVVVKDRIPEGTELTGTIPQAELDDKTLVWKLGKIAPGEERKIAVRVTPMLEGQVGSIATVNFVAEVASRTRITASKLKLTLDGPEQARLGESIVFRFVLENAGKTSVSGVVLRSIIPKGLRHPSGDDLEYDIGTLAAGESREIKLTMSTTQAGQIIKRAIATAEGGIEVKSSMTIDIEASTVSISRKGPAKAYPGRSIIFSNQITNETDQTLANVTVVEILPEGVEFVEASSGGQYHAAKRTIAWRIDRLGTKQSKVLQVKVKPGKAGDYESSVRVITADGEASKSTSTLNVIGFPVLKVDSSAGDAPVIAGEKGTARFVVSNKGGAAAGNVRIVISVPAEIEVQSIRSSVDDTRKGDRIEFATIASLAAGDETVIELSFMTRKPTDARINIAVMADHMSQSLNSQAAVLVIPDGE